MLLLFTSFLLIFIFTQRKKLQYHQSLHALQESQQRQLIEAAVRSEETERQRIAEQLHDEIGSLLSTAKLYFKMINVEHYGTAEHELYDKGNELLNESISRVRGISHSLHSYILQEFGLNEAIKHFTDKIADGEFIRVTTSLDQTYITHDPQRDISIYRILQELFSNVLKHAQAVNIHISSAYKDNSLTLNITHNGKGLTQDTFEELRYTNDGLGLKNIQNRINLFNGEIIFSKSSKDYFIQIYFPNL
jgi:signal transduction histidine kinase